MYVPPLRKLRGVLGSFSSLSTPPPPTFYGPTSDFTRFISRNKYFCHGLNSMHVNRHDNRTMWTKVCFVNFCRWGKRAAIFNTDSGNYNWLLVELVMFINSAILSHLNILKLPILFSTFIFTTSSRNFFGISSSNKFNKNVQPTNVIFRKIMKILSAFCFISWPISLSDLCENGMRIPFNIKHHQNFQKKKQAKKGLFGTFRPKTGVFCTPPQS